LSSVVGNLTLPIPAGATNEGIDDPTVSGVANYLQFWLKNSLNAKLSNTQGTSADACPNVFRWDPSTYFTRGDGDGASSSLPALYVWWSGKSSLLKDRSTTIFDCRERQLEVAYIFEELQLPNAANARRGLLNAVDMVFFKAGERWRHSGYQNGAWILSALNLLDFTYSGGQKGSMEMSVPGVEGSAPRGFPTLRGSFRVLELIEQEIMTDDDLLGDSLISISATDGSAPGSVEIMDRYMPGPDGSEIE